MPSSLASRTDSLALAAAISRHPAARARGTVSRPAAAASFTTVAGLLTGPWRVNDPVGFAAAMRAAPLVAGYPVVDLCACARQPTVGLDPLSAAVAGHLEAAVASTVTRSALTVRWVAARGGSYLFVEAAARAATDDEGPELLVLTHLVEPGERLPGAALPPGEDDSWVVAVVGDGRGGVTGIARAPLPRTPVPGLRPPPARLALGALRNFLVGPALAAEGLAPEAGGEADYEGVVLPFRR
ncbi:MAG: hypothetical protein LC792_14365 [Actinobacteria bacterium]|nr:hypothetical protein [Actinomycetota bacterium]